MYFQMGHAVFVRHAQEWQDRDKQMFSTRNNRNPILSVPRGERVIDTFTQIRISPSFRSLRYLLSFLSFLDAVLGHIVSPDRWFTVSSTSQMTSEGQWRENSPLFRR